MSKQQKQPTILFKRDVFTTEDYVYAISEPLNSQDLLSCEDFEDAYSIYFEEVYEAIFKMIGLCDEDFYYTYVGGDDSYYLGSEKSLEEEIADNDKSILEPGRTWTDVRDAIVNAIARAHSESKTTNI